MNNCATCRWWNREELYAFELKEARRFLEDGITVPWIEAIIKGASPGEIEHYKRSLIFRINIGYGDCHGLPEIKRGCSGDHFCGQWKGKDS